VKTFIPKKPVGDSALWTWRRWIWDYLAGGFFPIKGDGNIIVQFQQGVYRISSTSSSGGGKSSVRFRGEYDPTASYAIGDIVVIRAGANAGSYGCIQANSGTSPQLPDIGNLYWISLSGNAPVLGAWMI